MLKYNPVLWFLIGYRISVDYCLGFVFSLMKKSRILFLILCFVLVTCSVDQDCQKADIILWDISNLFDIPYYVTDHPIRAVIKNGEIVFGS